MTESTTATTNTATNEAKKEKEGKHLVWEPRVFDCFGKTTRINSKDLAIAIKQQFQQTFYDCIGCYISNPGNHIEVQLFFENMPDPVPEGKIKNLVNIANPGRNVGSSLYNKMNVLSKKTTGKTYELNQDTKELLSDFMYGGRYNKKRNWNDCVMERRENAMQLGYGFGSERIILIVSNLDINTLCRNLYGRRMVTETVKEGDEVVNKTVDAFYNCRMTPQSVLPDGSFMINIEQFAKDKVQEMFKAENPQYVQSSGLLFY